MKFTNGQWRMREGVTAIYPAMLWRAEVIDGVLHVYATAKSADRRGNLLDVGVLTFRISSPMPGVIRVRQTHWEGGLDRGGRFELEVDIERSHPGVSFREEPEGWVVRSGDLVARVAKGGNWGLRFEDGAGNLLTGSGWRGTGLFQAPEGVFMRESLTLGVGGGTGTQVYGLGEQFGPMIKNGQSVEMWNEDGATSSQLAYKCVPFYLTNRGYGVFVNQAEKVSFEVGSEHVERVVISVPGESLDYFVIGGGTPKKVLEHYTALTGRPALPPKWSFGLWLSTSFTTNYDEKTVTEFVEGMAKRDIPLGVFHYDCFWMRPLHWCDFEWDPAMFPDPAGMLARLKARGLKICVWINPYVSQLSKLFAEGKRDGYFIRKVNGDVWQTDLWQPGMAVVDFTNPKARSWFQSHLRRLMAMGVDCFKTDFGERIPAPPASPQPGADVMYHDGSDVQKMHNLYSYLYNKTVFEVLEAEKGRGNAIVFARSGTAGSQKLPVHWGGDSFPTFESMAESLRGGLSLGMCGFGFWSHDIGGFGGVVDGDVAAVYKRWVAFGLLSSHSRLHGAESYRVPWAYDDEATEVLRRFTKLKLSLMPYLWETAQEASERGVPMLRAMVLEFPEDPTCAYLDRQYMLGPSLLVAPVFDKSGWAEFYLPAGVWTDWFTGEKLAGGRWVRRQCDYLTIPLYAREGSRIRVGKVTDRADYDYEQESEERVF